MPTPTVFTIDDLDAEIKAIHPELVNRSDFATLRNRAYRRALVEYEATLMTADDIFIRADTFAAALSTGTEKVNTDVGDLYTIDLPADAERVAGNSILVSGSTLMLNVPRKTWDAIIAGGTGETEYAFWENDGQVVLYVKDGEFTAPAAVHLNYYRRLDATQTTGTELDIKRRDFGSIASATTAFLKSYI